MPTREDPFQNGPAQLPARCTANGIHALPGERSIVVGQIESTGVLRQVGDHEIASQANRQRNDAVHDE